MRKIYLSLATLLICLSAFAEEVSLEKASSYAKNKFNSRATTLVWNGNSSGIELSSTSTPAFYVLNLAEGGWAIISGDDCASPVLAYSDTGAFDESTMPDNMRTWMNKVRSNILKARECGVIASESIRNEWSQPFAMTLSSQGKLLNTAQWSQEYPYNEQCIAVRGTRYVTGCVATAASIVIRYHEHPEKGTGTLDSYTTNSERLRINGYSIDDHYYDYEKMPLSYNSKQPWTEEEVFAVSQLIHDVGVMVRMDYAADGSGAYTEDLCQALAEHMGYSPNAKYIYRSSYSNSEWLRMLTEEIDNEKPIVYSGTEINENAGHAFVCDGYDGQGRVHINWGWGGVCNCYVNVTYLDSTQGVYSRNDAAIFGLRPAFPEEIGESNEGEAYIFMYPYYGNGLTVNGKFSQGESITYKVNSLANLGSVTYTGKVALAHIDSKGNVKARYGKETSLSIASNRIYMWSSNTSAKITEPVLPGDALCIVAMTKDGSWEKVARWENSVIESYGAIDSYLIDMPDSSPVGVAIYPNIISGRMPFQYIDWYLDGEKVPSECITPETEGTHTVKAVVHYYGSTETDTIYKRFKAI